METIMKMKLLAGASTLVLALGFSASALAQNNTANDNDPYTAITQDSNSDAVAGGSNAVENGAIATTGNALGSDANNNAAASRSSTAVQIDAQEFFDGEAIGGGTVTYEGSQLNVGNNNKPASASLDSAAATGRGTAYSVFGEVGEGSSQVLGTGNSTATAEDGGAAVGGSGTAIGINDVTIGHSAEEDGDGEAGLIQDQFQDQFGEFNQQQQQQQQQNQQNEQNTQVIVTDTLNVDGDGIDFGGGDDATVAFGVNNTVASAHLDSTVSGLALAISTYDEENNNGHAATITTGSIFNNTLSSASGANRIVFNTGIANQGRALAVAADTSFGSQ